MFWDDLRKLLAGPQLYRLDHLIAVRLVPIFYAFGLAAIGLWVIDHLVVSFALSFSQGLWGLLEIIVFAPLMALGLRIASELVMVFFQAHEAAAANVDRRRSSDTLLEEVSDAIHDLAEDDDRAVSPTQPGPSATARPTNDPTDPLIKRQARRTARRTPPPP